MEPAATTDRSASSPALFVLKAYGDVERPSLAVLDRAEASVVEQDWRWTLEVVIRTESLSAAGVLAQTIVAEASFDLGTWYQWHVDPAVPAGAQA